MNEFRFEVKYMLKIYYNLHIMKEMKRLLVESIEVKEGKESREYALATQDYDETKESIKIIKNMVSTYYNVEDETEIEKKISNFIRNDPHYQLTTSMAEGFYKKFFKKMPAGDEIN
jgi:hypothetical protein